MQYICKPLLKDTAKQPTLLHIRMYVHIPCIRVYSQTRVIGIELELELDMT